MIQADPTHHTYDCIASLIAYIKEHTTEKITLETLATQAGLSPFHLQKVFTSWVGLSPKQLISYLSVQKAKERLRHNEKSLLDNAYELGFSSPSRLHDLFIRIERMTPQEYRQGGESLCINYSMEDTLFGKAFVASTWRGVCCVAFEVEEPARQEALNSLQRTFKNAKFVHKKEPMHQLVYDWIATPYTTNHTIPLHLKGTDFQIQVWEAILCIPLGSISHYGVLAGKVGSPQASRAVGTAVGANPIAYLIPCHRVLRQNIEIGAYRWGSTRKAAMLLKEQYFLKELQDTTPHP